MGSTYDALSGAWSSFKSVEKDIVQCVAPLLSLRQTDVSRDHRAAYILTKQHLLANVDWALLNFMKDWFPLEARKKLHQNEREAAEEEMKELGLNTNGCTTM